MIHQKQEAHFITHTVCCPIRICICILTSGARPIFRTYVKVVIYLKICKFAQAKIVCFISSFPPPQVLAPPPGHVYYIMCVLFDLILFLGPWLKNIGSMRHHLKNLSGFVRGFLLPVKRRARRRFIFCVV